jgi:hypothetical protein
MPEITLACMTDSDICRELTSRLEEKGYIVKHIASGRQTPVAEYGGSHFIGYEEIVRYFC